MAELNYKFLSGNLDLEEVEVKGVKEYYVSGYLTTGERDLVNDIVTSECQDDMLQQLKEKNIKIDVEHELWKKEKKTTIPAGRIIDARKDSKGIRVKVHLNRNYPNFKGLLEQIQKKFLDAFSIAFQPLKFTRKEVDGVKTRFLNKLLLLNAAMTGNPANTGCGFGDVVTKSIHDFEVEEKKRLYEDIKLKILEEKKMEEEKKTPVEETPEKEETKGKPTEAKELTELKETISTLKAEVSALKEEKTLQDRILELKGKILDREEFKDVREASEATERDEEITELKNQIVELYALISAPQLKGIQSAPPTEEEKTGELAEKAEGKTTTGPLDYIR